MRICSWIWKAVWLVCVVMYEEEGHRWDLSSGWSVTSFQAISYKVKDKRPAPVVKGLDRSSTATHPFFRKVTP